MKTEITAEKNIDKTAAELKALISEAETILADSENTGSDKITEIRDRMEVLLKDGQEKLEQLKVVAKEKLEDADEYVRSHPYQAAGVAAGVGAIVGGVLAAKSSK